jgi:glucose-6-phosphate 1-dehydrogenase
MSAIRGAEFVTSSPRIGVAKSGWTIDQFRARAHDSLAQHGGEVDEGAFAKLMKLLQYIDGDYQDPATFEKLRKAIGGATVQRIIWPFRQTCSAVSWNLWENRDVRKTLASSSRNLSDTTFRQPRN